jgi:hypothetical protein
MKRYSAWLVGAAVGLALASSALAGPTNVSPSMRVDSATIAQLEKVARETKAEAGMGNKNNAAFQFRYAQINGLIDRLKKGENVDPAEIDKAMAPVQVW